jgi:hypothetical protein
METSGSQPTPAPEAKPKPSFLKRLPRLARFLLIQAVILFVLLELVGRIADPLGISYYPETARYLDTLVREEPIGYHNRPGLTGRYWGKMVEINSLGLRDRELPLEPPADEFRILVMGDSFPFGIGVDNDQAIPRRLEEIANAKAKGPPHYRAINMGVPSYNTEQELIQFKQLGRKLHPKLVVLLFSSNDIEPKMWVLNKRSSFLTDVGQRSYAVCFVTVLYRQVVDALTRKNTAGTVYKESEYRLDNPHWQSIDQSLSELGRLCREMGIPLIVFFKDPPGTGPMQMLQAVGRREGIPMLYLDWHEDARYNAADRRAYVNSAVDSHPNPVGCEMYGTLMYDALAGGGWLK